MSNTVILGAGIIGCSTAYYLSQSSRTEAQTIHIVEPSPALFHCASGLAGGFLAEDWFAPSVAPLGALSFKLHQVLAEKYNGKERWGYSRSTATSLSQDNETVGGSGEDWLQDGTSRAQQAAGARKYFENGEGPAWLTRTVNGTLEVISNDNSTAQIDPLRFSRFLLDQCLARGVELHHPARAISVSTDIRGNFSSIRILSQDGTETDIPCTRLVICAGAWTPKVFSTLFPSSPATIPIAPLAGHSLLLKSPRWAVGEDEAQGCHAVFATDTLGFSPELFSRADGEIYIAGLNSTMIPLPNVATESKLARESVDQLKQCAAQMLGLEGGENDLQILREGLCFRPVTSSGRPIISRISDAKLGGGISTIPGAGGGVYIASGHGAWGISQAPGTGFVMAELLEGLTPSANIRALSFF